MFGGPFKHQGHRPARKRPAQHAQVPRVDQRFVLAVERMKMWWSMLS
jgi:hypothetical protein